MAELNSSVKRGIISRVVGKILKGIKSAPEFVGTQAGLATGLAATHFPKPGALAGSAILGAAQIINQSRKTKQSIDDINSDDVMKREEDLQKGIRSQRNRFLIGTTKR